MASFFSTSEAVGNLWLYKLPAGRAISCEKCVRVNDVTVFLGKNGKLYCDKLSDYAYTMGRWPWNDSLMKALVKIGAIAQSDADQHIADSNEIADQRDKKRASENLRSYLDKLGIELTKAQKKKLVSKVSLK